MTPPSCEQCASAIDPDAIRCPECGYSPVDDGRLVRKICLIVGVILTGTLIGSPIGLPMMAAAWWVERRKQSAGASGVRV